MLFVGSLLRFGAFNELVLYVHKTSHYFVNVFCVAVVKYSVNNWSGAVGCAAGCIDQLYSDRQKDTFGL